MKRGLNARVRQNIFSVSVRSDRISFQSTDSQSAISPLSWKTTVRSRWRQSAARTGNMGHGHPSAHRAAGYGASALTLTAVHTAKISMRCWRLSMPPVNKQAIAVAAFGRAARSYSQHDELQRQSAQGLSYSVRVVSGTYWMPDAAGGKQPLLARRPEATSPHSISLSRCWTRRDSNRRLTISDWRY